MPSYVIFFKIKLFFSKGFSNMKSLILVSVAITVAVAQRGEGPQCIQNFYDKMLNNPRRFGQNLTFIQENFHEDWNTRPNPLKPTGTYL